MFNFRKKLSDYGEIEVSDAMTHGGEHERRKIEEPVGLENLRRLLAVIVLLIGVAVFRTAYLQVAKGSYYLNRAENNRISQEVIKAPRGIIVDRNGEELVANMASFDAVIVPALLPREPEQRVEVLKSCLDAINLGGAGAFNVPSEEDLKSYSFKPFLLKENISREEAIEIELVADKCPGFRTEKTAVREYKDAVFFAHLLGYTGKVTREDLERDPDYLMTDYVGRSGIEEYWEEALRGVHGYSYVEVDSSGKALRELEEDLPQPGRRLKLGIDKNLQIRLAQAMEQVMDGKEAEKAAAVAIDPRNGLVRALVSLPSFDNNLFSGKISQEDYERLANDSRKPLLNRAIGGTYAPGSTIKPLLGVAVLEEGVVSKDTSLNCPGALYVGSWRFGDWKTHGPNINLTRAIAESCDVYFYTMGGGYGDVGGLGIDRIKQYADLFGLGEVTGVDLDGEAAGFVPSPSWKEKIKGERWYIGNTYHASIGQGDVLATPIQIADYIAAIANGGTLYEPRIVAEIIDEETGEVVEELGGQARRLKLAKPENIVAVREGMKETVLSGTAQMLKELGHDICGKTGTAQIGGTENTHSWFTGFAPYDNPEIVIAVLVEEGGESTDAAVPVAKEFFKYYFNGEEGAQTNPDQRQE